MIDVKEVKEANEATAQARKECVEKLLEKGRQNSFYGLGLDPMPNTAEMVTITADRFEKMIRKIESQRNDLFYYDEKLSRAYDFINTVALEWAEKGKQIPTYEDMFRMAEILGWSEPFDIQRTRNRVAAEKAAARKEKEVQENAEATD